MVQAATYYEVLGVPPNSTLSELRAAYRSRARACHPDLAVNTKESSTEMAKLNEAWRVLSDSAQRKQYDLRFRTPLAERLPTPQTARERREFWAAGIQAQITRLASLAGRSATQTMLTRQALGSRQQYKKITDELVKALAQDVEARVRAARAGGAAPLDLGVAAVLVGLRSEADRLRRASSLGIDNDMMMRAQLLDRMWDVLAHELPTAVPAALGGNPALLRFLAKKFR